MPATGASTGPAWFGDDRPPAKMPLKANVFETMMTHQGMQQQKELFPYFDPGSLTTGQLYVQSTTHGVTMFLKKAAAPEMENYQVSIITIRMKASGPQNEAMMFRCSSCNEVVFRYDRDVSAGPPHKYYRELPNIRLYADAVDAFNASDRTCPGCGEQQQMFPQDLAGWRRYAQHVSLANRAREQTAHAAD
jgi:hypothetical protein